MVNKGEKTEITTLKCREKATKGQKKVRKNVLVRSEKIWKKVPKVRKNGIFDKSEKIGNPVWQLCISGMEWNGNDTYIARQLHEQGACIMAVLRR